MKRHNIIQSISETKDTNGMNDIDNNSDYERDSFLTTSPSNHSPVNMNTYRNNTFTYNHKNTNHNKGSDRSYRSNKNQNYSYNPVLQTNFDLNPITSSTKAATSYMDEIEVIQTIGTSHSRKGKYIRSTWKKDRRMKQIVYAFSACFILLILYSSSRPSSPKSLKDENHNSGNGDADDTNDNKNHYFHHGESHIGEDDSIMGGEYAHLQINDYTNLNPKRVHSSSYTQSTILKKITKSCLKQSQYEEPSQEQIDMLCNNPKCTIENPFLGQGYDEQTSSSWNKALDMNIGLIENYLTMSYTYSHDSDGDHDTDDGISTRKNELDIVFYGDSITEQWNGRWLGNEITSKSKIESIYRQYFDPFPSRPPSTEEGGEDEDDEFHTNSQNNKNLNMNLSSLKGLALGIAGDKTTNLLYRLQKGGELPDQLQSKVYWLLIGTNDLSQNCSEDIVILGILSIVQEIRLKKPDSIVVINGLLPRTDDADGRLIRTSAIISTDFEGQSETSSSGSSSLGVENEVDDKIASEIENEIETNSQEEASIISSSSTTTATNSSLPSSNTSNSSSHYNNIRHYQKERHESSDVASKNSSPIFNYWPSIEAINYQLKVYAEKHDKVEYFDPSHLFLAQMGNEFYKQDDLFLMKELQDDFLHPTALGHEIWAKVNTDKRLQLFQIVVVDVIAATSAASINSFMFS